MMTSYRLTLSLAILTMVTCPQACGQLPDSDALQNEHRNVLQSGYQSERYFSDDLSSDERRKLFQPAIGSPAEDFADDLTGWLELSLGEASDHRPADLRILRSPELPGPLAQHAEQVRYRIPLDFDLLGDNLDAPVESRGNRLSPGDQREVDSLRDGQDPFIPAPLPDSQRDRESSAIDEIITIRYQNPATVRAIRAMSESQAVQLFSEVSQMIDERSFEPTSYEVRVRRALRDLTIALDNRDFVDGLGLTADSFQLDGFRNTLARLADSGQVRTHSEAVSVLNTVMKQSRTLKGLTPAVVGFEFTNASIDTLDKFSGLEPIDPALRNGARKDEHRSDVLEEEIVGIGLEVREHDEGLIVVKPLRGGPAAEAEIEPGDIIRSIDGQDIRGMKIVSSLDLLRGPTGSQMKIRIERGGSNARELVLTRRIVRVWTVNDAKIVNGTDVGYFSLSRFSRNSTAELDQALNSLHNNGMKSLIIDLRGDPGGLLTTCVEITDRFVPCGIIVSTKGRLSSDDMIQKATYPKTWSVPLVVLMDGNSASASEIFAAAIQENRRGLVVGTHSFGKGTVQTHFPLSSIPGDLRLTTAMFYSPNGRIMSGNGVMPDVEVQDDDGVLNGDEVLTEAVRIAQGQTLKDMAVASGTCRPVNLSASRRSILDGIVDPSHPGTIVL